MFYAFETCKFVSVFFFLILFNNHYSQSVFCSFTELLHKDNAFFTYSFYMFDVVSVMNENRGMAEVFRHLLSPP